MLKKRGRPVYSQVRQHIAEILSEKGKAYGYEIYKAYCSLFPKVTLRLMYYHLRKGIQTGEFKKEQVIEKGEYSWGTTVEKIYYSIADNVNIEPNQKVKDYFKK